MRARSHVYVTVCVCGNACVCFVFCFMFDFLFIYFVAHFLCVSLSFTVCLVRSFCFNPPVRYSMNILLFQFCGYVFMSVHVCVSQSECEWFRVYKNRFPWHHTTLVYGCSLSKHIENRSVFNIPRAIGQRVFFLLTNLVQLAL